MTFIIGEDEGEEIHGETQKEPESKEKKNIDFKSHLNGLYNGLAKIMTTTCNLENSTSQAPFVVEKAVHNIMFIKHHMKRQDEFDAVSIFWLIFGKNL